LLLIIKWIAQSHLNIYSTFDVAIAAFIAFNEFSISRFVCGTFPAITDEWIVLSEHKSSTMNKVAHFEIIVSIGLDWMKWRSAIKIKRKKKLFLFALTTEVNWMSVEGRGENYLLILNEDKLNGVIHKQLRNEIESRGKAEREVKLVKRHLRVWGNLKYL
jgi:hypothetical protein